jgi:hypothetical protein
MSFCLTSDHPWSSANVRHPFLRPFLLQLGENEEGDRQALNKGGFSPVDLLLVSSSFSFELRERSRFHMKVGQLRG